MSMMKASVFTKVTGAAIVAIVLLAGTTGAQTPPDPDTAKVPFVVNADASVTAVPAEDGADDTPVTMTVTAGEEKTLLILVPKNDHTSINSQLQSANRPAIAVGTRGKITLNLPNQLYQTADISLYSINGKRVMRGKASALGAVKNISRPGVAPGIYLLSVKGTNGNKFTSRVPHQGGTLNINVAFGGSASLIASATKTYQYNITVSATGYVDSVYTLSVLAGTNEGQEINLRRGVYTITFDANGGTVEPTSGTTGDEWVLSSLPTPTRDGYTFGGWFTEETGGTAVSTTTVFSADATIYAQWEDINYTITWHLDGGSPHMYNYSGYTVGTPEQILSLIFSAPTKKGYTFGGWYENSEFTGNRITFIPAGSTGDREYWAKWIPFTITFDANDGIVSTTSGTTEGGKLASLPQATREGWPFAGWFTEQVGGTRVTTDYEFTASGTIYARWTYTITFDASGGSVSPRSDITGVGGRLESLPVPTKEDDTFIGWFTEMTDGVEVTTETVFTADVTIYAQYQLPPCGGFVEGTTREHFGVEKPQFCDARDGKRYVYKTIGNQTWMAENLNYNVENSWCYDDNPDNCDTYGRLYAWNTVMAGESSSASNPSGVQGVCPAGWHLPSTAEWDELMGYADPNYLIPNSTWQDNNVARVLKSREGWHGSVGNNGNDTHGFTALPGGYRIRRCIRPNRFGGCDEWGFVYENVNYGGNWWSATYHILPNWGGEGAGYQFLSGGNGVTPGGSLADPDPNSNSAIWYSVRCVKD